MAEAKLLATLEAKIRKQIESEYKKNTKDVVTEKPVTTVKSKTKIKIIDGLMPLLSLSKISSLRIT